MTTFKNKCKEFLDSKLGMNCSNCIYSQPVYTLEEDKLPNLNLEIIPNLYFCKINKKVYGKLHTCNNFIDINYEENEL